MKTTFAICRYMKGWKREWVEALDPIDYSILLEWLEEQLDPAHE